MLWLYANNRKKLPILLVVFLTSFASVRGQEGKDYMNGTVAISQAVFTGF